MRARTLGKGEAALGEDEQLNALFLGRDLAADYVDILDQADIGLDEGQVRLAIDCFALLDDLVGCLLGAADEIDAGLGDLLDKFVERILANAASRTGEDSRQLCGQCGRDALV